MSVTFFNILLTVGTTDTVPLPNFGNINLKFGLVVNETNSQNIKAQKDIWKLTI